MEMVSKSAKETAKIAARLARKVPSSSAIPDSAFVIALEGELGSGKTTFVQGFAKTLGIKEKVLSPTFVMMKVYPLRQRSNVKGQMFRHLVHIDCYRLEKPQELLHLGFKQILKDKDALVLIEWADRIKKLIPENTLRVLLLHGRTSNERILKIHNF